MSQIIKEYTSQIYSFIMIFCQTSFPFSKQHIVLFSVLMLAVKDVRHNERAMCEVFVVVYVSLQVHIFISTSLHRKAFLETAHKSHSLVLRRKCLKL